MSEVVFHPLCAHAAFSKFQTLFAENKEKLINIALASLIDNERDQLSLPVDELEAQFQALRRLVASKAGFSAFTLLPQYAYIEGWTLNECLILLLWWLEQFVQKWYVEATTESFSQFYFLFIRHFLNLLDSLNNLMFVSDREHAEEVIYSLTKIILWQKDSVVEILVTVPPNRLVMICFCWAYNSKVALGNL